MKQNSLCSNAVITSDEYRINLNQEKSISKVTSNVTGAEPLRQISVDRTLNITEPSNPVMDAFYYLFGWK